MEEVPENGKESSHSAHANGRKEYTYIWWVKEEGNVLHKITRRKANRIGHILRRNCLLKHVIEGK